MFFNTSQIHSIQKAFALYELGHDKHGWIFFLNDLTHLMHVLARLPWLGKDTVSKRQLLQSSVSYHHGGHHDCMQGDRVLEPRFHILIGRQPGRDSHALGGA